MKSTQTISTLVLALTLGSASASASSAVNNAPVAAVAVNEVEANNNQEVLNGIQVRIDALEKNLNDAKDIADALNMTANYQSQIDNLTTALANLKAQFAADIEAGLVVEGYQLEGLSTAEGQISQLMQPLNGMFNSMLNGCFQRSFPVLYSQINPTVSQLESKLQGWGLTEQFATLLSVVQAKAQEASAKLTEYQTNVTAETNYKKKLELAQEAEAYINSAKNEIMNLCAEIEAAAKAIVDAKEAANKAAYERLTADFAAFQALYQTVYSEFQAIASYYQSTGNAWPQAQTYGGQLGGMQSGMQGINATLQQANAAGTLTAETTLASLYPQYADMEGSLNSMKSQFEPLIAGLVQRSIMPDVSAKLQTSIPSAIGEVENQLAAVGMTEQYADRMAALNDKKAEASDKFNNEYMPAISAAFSNGNYAEAMNQATAASVYVNGILNEVNTECAAIKAEIEEAYNALVAANDAAYERLSAQIADLEAYYNEVYALFMQAAPTQPQGWAMTYGNQLGGIQGAIQGLKGSLGAAYGSKKLTAESNINEFGNYDTLMEQLDSIKAAILVATSIDSVTIAEKMANGQVFDATGKRAAKGMKGLIIVNGKKVVVK